MPLLLALEPALQAEEFYVVLVTLQQFSEHGFAGRKQSALKAYLCDSEERLVIIPVLL